MSGFVLNLIPVGFMKLPDIQNIGLKPSDPYDLATVGRLHSAKFEMIYAYITDKSDSEIDLRDVLEGHRLQNVLSKMKKSELADFCRHTIIANKNDIGWQNVDSLLASIDEFHFPSWELPDFKFDRGFREIFSTIIKWDFEPHIEKLVKDFIASEESLTFDKTDLIAKMSSEFHYWSFKELWLFYNAIVNYCNSYSAKDEVQKYTPLVTTLTNLFRDQLENPNYNLYQKVALALIFTKVYVKLGSDFVTKANELIDKRWREVEKLSQQEITSFRYLFGASYSIIGFHIFNSQTNFIMRRRLLGRLITNFIQPKELDITTWFRYLLEGEIHPLVLDYILTGYSHILPILRIHSAEFPKGETRSELLKQIEDISVTLQKTVFNYLTVYHKIPSISELTSKQFLQYFNRSSLLNEVKYTIQEILVQTIRNLVHLNGEGEDPIHTKKLIELGKQIATNTSGDKVALIYDLDLNLRLGNYPFQRIYEAIEKETEETLSIILSTTFENEIIKTISMLMDYLLQINQRTGNLDIDSYEVLLCFAGEWLQYFLTSDQLYNEALMVVAPIISICYVQIARGFFERNMTEKAFLTYINMYYFVELFMDEIKQS
ncbi:MAG: hypothetical protein ACXAD7_12120, partial [Candidatus Kariarchaeaceae archaeon]